MSGDRLNITVCGGGRTGHLAAILFKQLKGVGVSLLTGNESVVRNHGMSGLKAYLPDGKIISARLDVVSTSAGQALKDADIVIITVPAHARPDLLERIRDYLPDDRKVFVGAMPGFCGFDWQAERILLSRENVVIWGMKDVPHIAADLDPGKSIRMGGAKATLYVATHERESPEDKLRLLEILRTLYSSEVRLLASYLEITLTPGNPIMHPPALYGLIGPYGQWFNRPFGGPCCWWSDCSELGAYFIQRCDEENQAIKKAAEKCLKMDLSGVKPLINEIVEGYGEQISDTSSMLTVLRTNKAYSSIRIPMVPTEDGYVVDRSCRAFHEDAAFGLELLVEMARSMSVPCPHMQEILEWCRSYVSGFQRSSLEFMPR